MKQKGSAGTGGAAVAVVLVLLLLLIAALAGVMFTFRKKSQYISFIYRVVSFLLLHNFLHRSINKVKLSPCYLQQGIESGLC